MIELKHLSKTFRTKDKEITALEDINLTINDGEIFGIIGLSGAGKSTLVRCINLLERPTAGEVIIDGKSIGELPEKELLEIYIDMTAGNDFTDEENPCYRDLYLDLVVNPEGAVRLLDEDELEQAYSEGKVTPEEYARTKSCALELRDYLEIHAREVLDYIQAEMDGRKMPDMAAPDDRNT